jgi:hypothetical protein
MNAFRWFVDSVDLDILRTTESGNRVRPIHGAPGGTLKGKGKMIESHLFAGYLVYDGRFSDANCPINNKTKARAGERHLLQARSDVQLPFDCLGPTLRKNLPPAKRTNGCGRTKGKVSCPGGED